jgi:tetratricopeptide (TPR) repeat protein
MSAPSVFISYSHKDERWKDRIVTHLRVLRELSAIEIWDDRQIGIGENWYREIEKAIAEADVAVLLVSADFLGSKFILDEEVPRLLQRREKNELHIIAIIIRPCAWRLVDWLKRMQLYPKDAKPLSSGNTHKIDENLATITETIYNILSQSKPTAPSLIKLSLAKLPLTDAYIFGREKELLMLDAAWNNHRTNIVTLVAWGGVGKTALVNKWLSQMAKDNYRGAERVFCWSFYSQGTSDRVVSADIFIAEALKWFGDTNPWQGSPWDKGERLAELIRQQRTLLILDGLEPLQSPFPVETGKIKDPGLTALLRELARQNPGLVVISTRLPVDDLKDCQESTVLEIDLENLSREAGAAYLSHLGVDGTDAERQAAANNFGGHALALTLMGSYLKVMHNGDIRKQQEIPYLADDQKQGVHVRRLMESYEYWLKGKPELDILRLMGLFDRPSSRGAMEALRKEPAIQGLTDTLQKLKDADWQFAVANLRDLGLLARPSTMLPTGHSTQDEELDCHPLLREHFGEKLKVENPKAWCEAHGRLYEYYKSAAKEYPDTLEEMVPLYEAVFHGCHAGRHQEVLEEVYWRRISRGRERFALLKLSAFGADLTALSGFFDPPWRKPVDGLREDWKGFVLNEAGFDLRALGRLVEAAQPMQASLETMLAQKNWNQSAKAAGNLSELTLILGDVTQALAYSEQSVQLADRSGDPFQRMVNRTKIADAQHQAGRLAEAQAAFHEAEEMQTKGQPEFPLLYSVQGHQYCDLLLSQGDYVEAGRRASQILEWANQYGQGLLSIALDNLSLGRAHLLQSQREPDHPFNESLNYLNRAVDGLRQAGDQTYVPQGLLARTEVYRLTGALDKAQRDLDEAFSIAARGGMGLHLADCHLEYARLYIANVSLRGGVLERSEMPKQSPPESGIASQSALAMTPEQLKQKARQHWEIAQKMIEKMGYHRRDKEMEELEKRLKS